MSVPYMRGGERQVTELTLSISVPLNKVSKEQYTDYMATRRADILNTLPACICTYQVIISIVSNRTCDLL